jgi:hypothetical protein
MAFSFCNLSITISKQAIFLEVVGHKRSFGGSVNFDPFLKGIMVSISLDSTRSAT